MDDKTGGPAFPETRWDDKFGQDIQWMGMTLRDYFAAASLSGILAQSNNVGFIPTRSSNGKLNEQGETLYEWRKRLYGSDAETAYMVADAMLAERNKEPATQKEVCD